MKKSIRNRIIVLVIIAVVILVVVRIRVITNGSHRSEAAETRLMLEAMEEQDISAIQEEIDLKRSLMDAAGGNPEESSVASEETEDLSGVYD